MILGNFDPSLNTSDCISNTGKMKRIWEDDEEEEEEKEEEKKEDDEKEEDGWMNQSILGEKWKKIKKPLGF